jgi:hypothetical protein
MRKILILSTQIVGFTEYLEASIVIVVLDDGNFYYSKLRSSDSLIEVGKVYPANCLNEHLQVAIKAINS